MQSRSNARRLLTASGFAVLLAGLSATASFAADKVYICHATGSEGNPYVAISIDAGAWFDNGHLDASGNPLSGHEHDFGPVLSREECRKAEPPK
jgi:hypothetical protein